MLGRGGSYAVVEAMRGMSPQTYSCSTTAAIVELIFVSACLLGVMAGSKTEELCSMGREGKQCLR